MKALFKIVTIIALAYFASIEPSMAQKEKVTLKKGKALFNKIKALNEPAKEPTLPTNANEKPEETPEAKKRMLTPPDVQEQISSAREAYASSSYTQARFYVQQAIIGIELEIGYKILESMPETVFKVPADKAKDQVFSAGAGFMGMIVSREYPQDVGHTTVSVVNNPGLYANMQLALSSPAMTEYDDQNKIILYKGYKTLLEADDYAGFKMTVPFTNSSLFILECPQCESESQLTRTADLFDIEKFSNLLGEK